MDEKYQEICDYVCELFGREEDADQLKEGVEVKPASQKDEFLDSWIHEKNEETSFFEKFKPDYLKSLLDWCVLKTEDLKNSYHSGQDFIFYDEKSQDKESHIQHEMGHALYNLYKQTSGLSYILRGLLGENVKSLHEFYASVAKEKKPSIFKVQADIGENLLEGKDFQGAIESGITEQKYKKAGVLRQLLFPPDNDFFKHDCEISGVWRLLEEEYGEDLPEILGDALENPDVNFDSLEEFYQSLVENY